MYISEHLSEGCSAVPVYACVQRTTIVFSGAYAQVSAEQCSLRKPKDVVRNVNAKVVP